MNDDLFYWYLDLLEEMNELEAIQEVLEYEEGFLD